jgi:ribonuclease P protein component
VRFGKEAHLRSRRDFLAVQEGGRKLHSGDYLVLARGNELGHARLGITVSSRVGNAVVRNRVKRWVREAFRAAAVELPSMDIVVIARSSAPRSGLAAAVRAVAAACVRPPAGAPRRG